MKKFSLILVLSLTMSIFGYEVNKNTSFMKNIKVVAFEDPTNPWITIFLSYTSERWSFDDPSNVSIAVRQTKTPKSISKVENKNIFSRRSGIFKKMKVAKYYDSVSNSLIYVAYSEKGFMKTLSKKTSISVISLNTIK